jgi:hypothetical protein
LELQEKELAEREHENAHRREQDAKDREARREQDAKDREAQRSIQENQNQILAQMLQMMQQQMNHMNQP